MCTGTLIEIRRDAELIHAELVAGGMQDFDVFLYRYANACCALELLREEGRVTRSAFMVLAADPKTSFEKEQQPCG